MINNIEEVLNMTIYTLTVMVDTLNGRATAGSSGALIFPNGFHKNDLLTANQTSLVSGVTWYGVIKCVRYGATVALPAPVVWASSMNGSTVCLRLDSTTTDPIPPVDPPATVYPKEIWLSMTEGGERRKYVLV
jgi:hypothetical protein